MHVVGRNASNTEPARFVVVLLKAKGAPILTPVKESGSTPCAPPATDQLHASREDSLRARAAGGDETVEGRVP